MRFYPVLLDLKGRPCCVVGGGAVAERKARTLVSCGARVTVVSPRVTPGIRRLVTRGKAAHVRAMFRPGMLKGFFVAVAATDDPAANSCVSAAALGRSMLVNVVDVPSQSNFIVPSSISRSGLILSISTSGKAPCLARRIRLDLEKNFVPRYASRLKVAGRARRALKKSVVDPDERRRVMNRLVRGSV